MNFLPMLMLLCLVIYSLDMSGAWYFLAVITCIIGFLWDLIVIRSQISDALKDAIKNINKDDGGHRTRILGLVKTDIKKDPEEDGR